MTDDLRTLAAEAMNCAFRDYTGTKIGETMWNLDMEKTFEIVAPAVLAAVLPAHRRQVLAEAIDVIEHLPFDRGHRDGPDAGGYFRPQTVLDAVRRLAETAPSTAPTVPQSVQNGSEVPEGTPAPQGPPETPESSGPHAPTDVYRAVAAEQVTRWGYDRTLDAAELAKWIHGQAEDPNLRADVDATWRLAMARLGMPPYPARQPALPDVLRTRLVETKPPGPIRSAWTAVGIAIVGGNGAVIGRMATPDLAGQVVHDHEKYPALLARFEDEYQRHISTMAERDRLREQLADANGFVGRMNEPGA